jgi:iron complex transport system substrate-binding protein
MLRIVSLIPSATEIVAALGFEDALVGRSHECDFPRGVVRLPVCTEPKIRLDGTSSDIDRQVKSVVEASLSVYRVFTDQLEALRPDVIVTQSQCEVCAVSLQDVEQAVCSLVSSKPKIVSLEPNRLADVWLDIARVAGGLGAQERGQALVADLQARLESVQSATRRLETRPTVACIEWTEPVMAAGNWMPELVDMAGGVNLFGEAGCHSPWLQWEDLIERDPDVIVILPCGFDLERTRIESAPLQRRAGWTELRAVRSGRVYVTDGNQYFNRPGPRLVESLEILAEILHPASFDFGHRGAGWQPL